MTGSPTPLSKPRFRGAFTAVPWPLIFTRALIYVILVTIAIVRVGHVAYCRPMFKAHALEE